MDLGLTTKNRARSQAMSNTETAGATVVRTYLNADGNNSSCDVLQDGQDEPLINVTNDSPNKWYVGARVTINFKKGIRLFPTIIGAYGSGTAGVIASSDGGTPPVTAPPSSQDTFDASQVVSGVLDVARIPNLAASKITSGTLDAARIPAINIAASQITSGIIDAARLPTVTFPKRLWVLVLHEANATVAAGTPVLVETVEAPYGIAGASITWVPILGRFYVPNPAVGATTVDVVYGATGNAAFGSGSTILTAPVSVSGTSNYRATDITTFASGVTVASGKPMAAIWSAIGGSNGTITIYFQEQ